MTPRKFGTIIFVSLALGTTAALTYAVGSAVWLLVVYRPIPLEMFTPPLVVVGVVLVAIYAARMARDDKWWPFPWPARGFVSGLKRKAPAADEERVLYMLDRYAPAAFAAPEIQQASGVGGRRLNIALSRLIAAGRVRVVPDPHEAERAKVGLAPRPFYQRVE